MSILGTQLFTDAKFQNAKTVHRYNRQWDASRTVNTYRYIHQHPSFLLPGHAFYTPLQLRELL